MHRASSPIPTTWQPTCVPVEVGKRQRGVGPLPAPFLCRIRPTNPEVGLYTSILTGAEDACHKRNRTTSMSIREQVLKLTISPLVRVDWLIGWYITPFWQYFCLIMATEFSGITLFCGGQFSRGNKLTAGSWGHYFLGN
jgi:hypothetical protein